MGYQTDFEGKFTLDAPLTAAQIAYLNAFSDTRRMARDPVKASKLPDPVREAVGHPIGPEGAFYVGSAANGNFGQEKDASVIDGNSSGRSMPGLWCQWVPTDDGTAIQWDGNEKFYEYEAWLSFVIDSFLKPWGRTLDGEVTWEGEDSSDRGKLIVKDNVVSVKRGRVRIEYR